MRKKLDFPDVIKYYGTVIAGVLIVLVFSGVRAWTQQADPATAVATPDTAAPVTLADAEGPVPVPEPSERAMRYYRTGSGIWLVMQ